MSEEAMRSTHDALDRLLDCHRRIAERYCELAEGVIDQLLGDHARGPLRAELKEHGDGYTLRSAPARTGDMDPAEDVVLIAWKFPLLGRTSEFDPCKSLTEIPYWRDCLDPAPCMPDGSERRLRFLIWQECCPVHGKTERDARDKRDLIRSGAPELDGLFERQAELSVRLLEAWAIWLGGASPRRRLVVAPDRKLDLGGSRIEKLLGGETLQIDDLDLVKDRCRIMTRIKEKLWEAEGR